MTDGGDAGTVSFTASERLDSSTIAELLELVDEAADADGVSPLSEHVLLHLRHGGDERGLHFIARDETGRAVAYAHLDVTDEVEGGSAELAVSPRARRRGLARTLVADHILRASPRVRLWAHGRQSAADHLARSMGFDRVRELLQMRRSLLAPLPACELPVGVTVRSFLPGVDDETWVSLNARAFAELPDQGSWTVKELHVRMAEPWFDPTGFLIAERDGAMVGFHWTKVHGQAHHHPHTHHHAHDHAQDHDHDHGPGHHDPGHQGGHGHPPMGEVYVIGVDPVSGRGLGAPLLLAGLAHLRAQGLTEAMLYVDSTNTRAIDLYERNGFVIWDRDVQYSSAPVTSRER